MRQIDPTNLAIRLLCLLQRDNELKFRYVELYHCEYILNAHYCSKNCFLVHSRLEDTYVCGTHKEEKSQERSESSLNEEADSTSTNVRVR